MVELDKICSEIRRGQELVEKVSFALSTPKDSGLTESEAGLDRAQTCFDSAEYLLTALKATLLGRLPLRPRIDSLGWSRSSHKGHAALTLNGVTVGMAPALANLFELLADPGGVTVPGERLDFKSHAWLRKRLREIEGGAVSESVLSSRLTRLRAALDKTGLPHEAILESDGRRGARLRITKAMADGIFARAKVVGRELSSLSTDSNPIPSMLLSEQNSNS